MSLSPARLACGRKWRREFYELLADRVENGIVLREAFVRIITRMAESSPKGIRIRALEAALERFDGGMRLGDALVDIIPDNERMLILSGENSGRIVENLRLAATASDTVALIRSKILKGLSMPVAMLAMVYGFLYWMGAYFEPQIASSIPARSWKGSAAQLRALATFCTTPWVVIVPAACVLLILLVVLRMPYGGSGRVRIALDRIPPWSLYRLLQGGGWIMAFASLVQSGYTHELAIRSLARNARPWLRARLDGILLLMGGGLNVGTAMRETRFGFPDMKVIDALEDYAGLTHFDRALMRVAERWIKSGLESVDRIMILLQTLFAVLIFAIFTWLMLAVNGIQNSIGPGLH